MFEKGEESGSFRGDKQLLAVESAEETLCGRPTTALLLPGDGWKRGESSAHSDSVH